MAFTIRREVHYHYIYRYACAIEMTDYVILTGGYDGSNRVHQYNLQGSLGRLPDLNIGRRLHACGHYVHQGEIVSTELKIRQCTPRFAMSVISEYYKILSAGIDCHRRRHRVP